MAEVSGNVIGNVKGKLGNLSARVRNGKTYLGARPSSFKVSNDPKSKKVRGCFKVSVDLAKTIIALPTLEELWRRIKPKGMSVFNLLVKENFDSASEQEPTADNVISPEGFSLPVTASAVTADDLTFELAALNSAGVFESNEKDLSLNAIIVYKNPSDPEDEPYGIVRFAKEESGFDFTKVYSGSFSLNVLQKALAAKYQDKIIYLAVATKTSGGEIIQCSSTYGKEI
ncbi:MAG: hypothetical protein ACEPO8_14870 [Rhodothermaceae bacterium]